MDKMKMQDTQLMQASGVTTTVIDQSSVIGTTPAINSSGTNALLVKGQTDHLSRACRSTRVEPFILTDMCRPTSTYMIGSSSIHVHQLIPFVIDLLCAMCNKQALCYPSQ